MPTLETSEANARPLYVTKTLDQESILLSSRGDKDTLQVAGIMRVDLIYEDADNGHDLCL